MDFTQNITLTRMIIRKTNVSGAANGLPWEEWQAHSKGQNILFADGHARWYQGYDTNEMTVRSRLGSYGWQ